jgi:glutaredoxin
VYRESGVIYEDSRSKKGSLIRDVVVTLFTKEGCTLCDKVHSVLEATSSKKYPHALVAVDITDSEYRDEWFERYKFDIPDLHTNGAYWTKHRRSRTRFGRSFEGDDAGAN